MTNYKVLHLKDEIYQVRDEEYSTTFFQESLSDCLAWITLAQGGYL